MYGITQKQSRRLQAIQNTLSRIISYLPRRASTSNARKLLHWLPVEFRVKFKLLVITYKALNTHQPPYLAGCLNEYSCNRYTRRSNPDNKFLNIPVFIHKTHKSKSHFDCSFEIAAPSLWNSLPLHVRTATSLASFRSRLKCHFFTLAFPPWSSHFAQCQETKFDPCLFMDFDLRFYFSDGALWVYIRA